jgi:hypothetical protein
MNKKSLIIAEPCNASWDAMDGDDQKRFCSSCTKNVHHLSKLTRREAEGLLMAKGGLCVRYSHDTHGRVKFAQKTTQASGPAEQARGAALLVAKAASLAGMLSACAWPIADRSEPTVMGQAPMHEVATSASGPTELNDVKTKPEPKPELTNDFSNMMGEPVWEPELFEMGDVAIDLDPLYQQEQLAAEELSRFNITLEEEEILPCAGSINVEIEEQPRVVPVMGRMRMPHVE